MPERGKYIEKLSNTYHCECGATFNPTYFEFSMMSDYFGLYHCPSCHEIEFFDQFGAPLKSNVNKRVGVDKGNDLSALDHQNLASVTADNVLDIRNFVASLTDARLATHLGFNEDIRVVETDIIIYREFLIALKIRLHSLSVPQLPLDP